MAALNGNNKMKVEVWSDIMCPFCYIGKRNYEKAFEQFAGNQHVELVWKSFQLDPTLPVKAEDISVSEYLSKRKGISPAQVTQMHRQVSQTAKEAGLEYHLENTVMVNSFKAHRLIQRAKEKGLGDKAEELLFYANFTEGKDFGDTAILTTLGNQIGLNDSEVSEALTDDKYATAVNHDIQEARELGVNGVPFFVFDRKYAVSGAQPAESFLQVLEKSYEGWRMEHPEPELQITNGPSCTPDGICE